MSQMKEACNMNIAEEFNPSWINVMDESMMGWFNKYAPGFVFIQCKPHPFGNERHTVCCGLIYIQLRSQIVEGKYHPQQLGEEE